MNEREMALDTLIYKVRTGSHLYRTNVATSDEDFVGICIPPPEYFYGLKSFDNAIWERGKDGQDFTIYSIHKLFRLLLGNNPNIVELLYVDEENVLYRTPYSDAIVAHSPAFISQKVKDTFMGYATAQKHKMQRDFVGVRKKDMEEYGYSTKFAGHIIRLYHECIELFISNKLTFPPFWADEVRAVRTGEAYGKDVGRLYARFEELEQGLDRVVNNTTLPKTPDFSSSEQLLMLLITKYWRSRRWI